MEKSNIKINTKIRHIMIYLALITGALTMLAPYFSMLTTSFKSLSETMRIPPSFLPEIWRYDNYVRLFDKAPVIIQTVNSLLIAFFIMLGQISIGAASAYAFARLEFPGKKIMFALSLVIMMVPVQLFIIPHYLIISRAGLLNSITAVVLPQIFSPYIMFLLVQHFRSVPREVEEAAVIDGAGQLRIFWDIMLPIIRPGIVTCSLLVFQYGWSLFFWPLIVNSSPDKLNLSAGIAMLQGKVMTDIPVLMAGAVLASAPMVILFFFTQKKFITAVSISAGKE